jgi:putative oxidoreductase
MISTNRSTQTQLQSYGIAALRMMVGVVFLVHGLQKLLMFGINGTAGFFAHAGLPMPMVSAVLATGAEFLGGLALLLGLFTRPAAAVLSFNMLVAVLAVHLKGGFFLPAGFEYALTLMVANIALILTGAGAFALDNVVHTDPASWRHTPTPTPLRG